MALVGNVCKIALELHTTDVNELVTFGLHSGDEGRTDGNLSDLMVVMTAQWADIAPLTAAHTLTAAVAYRYQAGPGFTGWHQVLRQSLSVAAGSSTKLPPQCAGVIGYKTTDSLYNDIAIGRKRNRIYVGPLAVSSIGSGGLFTSTMRNTMRDFAVDCHTGFISVGGVGGILDTNGLVVVSVSQNGFFPATDVTVGQVVDTMRSRRQQEPESPVDTPITPG